MCGFFGIIEKGRGGLNKQDFLNLESISHLQRRGPDQEGSREGKNSFFYHTRLVISSSFNEDTQPMLGPRGEVFMFNGEVYNYRDLARESKGDTSAIFQCLLANSFSGNSSNSFTGNFSGNFSELSRFRGCFSLSFWEEESQSLFLARDHLGVRPLYYSHQTINGEDLFLFSTNFKVILEFLSKRGIELSLNYDSLSQYKSLRYVADPTETLFNEIHQLAPGHYLRYEKNKNVRTCPFWELPKKNRVVKEFNEEALDDLYMTLKESIEMRVPDLVDYGSLLSGGLDSGLVTLLSQSKKNFSGGYFLKVKGAQRDHQRFLNFCQQYGVNGREIQTENEFYKDKISKEKLLKEPNYDLMDIPIGDNVITLYESLFKHCSKEVKVLLTGDGADEVFGGYIHHKVFLLGNMFHRIFPGFSKDSLLRLSTLIPQKVYQTVFPYPGKLSQEGINKFVKFLRSFSSPGLAYKELISLYDDDPLKEEGFLARSWPVWENGEFDLSELLLFDLKIWGPGYSLSKGDFMGGAFGLELRQPFYDYQLIEKVFSYDIPLASLRQDKILLRRLAKRASLEIAGKLGDFWSEGKFPFRVQDEGELLGGKTKVCQKYLEGWFEEIGRLTQREYHYELNHN